MMKAFRSLTLTCAALSTLILGGCGNPDTITSTQALQQASRAFVCPPGFSVAFESPETDLKKISKAMGTSQKMFNDIDCGRDAGMFEKTADIISILPFVSPTINTGIVLVNGQAVSMKYKDPNRKASLEPIRIKDDPSLDAYFQSQGFQKTSKDATKNIIKQDWNLYDIKSWDHVLKQYKADGFKPPAKP
jgi:hypothetical protein